MIGLAKADLTARVVSTLIVMQERRVALCGCVVTRAGQYPPCYCFQTLSNIFLEPSLFDATKFCASFYFQQTVVAGVNVGLVICKLTLQSLSHRIFFLAEACCSCNVCCLSSCNFLEVFSRTCKAGLSSVAIQFTLSVLESFKLI